MAPGRTVKVLLATCPRALLRSTLTVRSAKNAPLRNCFENLSCRRTSVYVRAIEESRFRTMVDKPHTRPFAVQVFSLSRAILVSIDELVVGWASPEKKLIRLTELK
jgi:hypothetical protein